VITPDQIMHRRRIEEAIDRELIRNYKGNPLEFSIAGMEEDIRIVLELYKKDWSCALGKDHQGAPILKFAAPNLRS